METASHLPNSWIHWSLRPANFWAIFPESVSIFKLVGVGLSPTDVQALFLNDQFLSAEDSFRESENRAESHSGSWSINNQPRRAAILFTIVTFFGCFKFTISVVGSRQLPSFYAATCGYLVDRRVEQPESWLVGSPATKGITTIPTTVVTRHWTGCLG